MPYIIIDKTLREVIATTLDKPTITDPNQLGYEVATLNNIAVRHQVEAPPQQGSYGISYVWLSGTSYTQAEIDFEVLRQSTYSTQIQTAITAIVASVNGKSAATLSATDAVKLVQLLIAKEGWIDGTGKVAVPATLQSLM